MPLRKVQKALDETSQAVEALTSRRRPRPTPQRSATAQVIDDLRHHQGSELLALLRRKL